MRECKSIRPLLESYLTREIRPEEEQRLRNHCRSCEDCRDMLRLDQDLMSFEREWLEPEDIELGEVRRRVLDRVAALPPSRRGWLDFVLQPAPALAAAFLLLTAGLWLGRLLPIGDVPSEFAETSALVRSINREAVSNQRLSDVQDSPYILSNVAFRRLGEDRVSLDFDVARHVTLTERIDSPVVMEVLAQSLLNPSPVGSKLKAMSYAQDATSPKVREALILAMLEDDNVAVRLKALSLLKTHTKGPEVEAAFLESLRRDPAVRVRLEALDYLAGSSVTPNLLRETIEEISAPSDPTLLLHAAMIEARGIDRN